MSGVARKTNDLARPASAIRPRRDSAEPPAAAADEFVSETIVDPAEQTRLGYHVSEPSPEVAQRRATVEIIGGPHHSEPKSAGSSQFRRFAQAVAAFLAEELAVLRPADANIPPADVSRRRGKEMSRWRRERRADECSAPTRYEDENGESSWSKSQAAELLGISKRKKKRSKSSDR